MVADRKQSDQLAKRLAWLQLVRLPNVFTVLADVSAAFLLVAGGINPSARFVLIVLSGVALYWSGMILNDVFDVEKDRSERPACPLASGAISVAAAQRAGWGLMALGVVLAALSGYVSADSMVARSVEFTWLPAAVASLLAIAIVLYDGPLKSTPAAPATMGSCRFLSFLLGASPVIPVVDSWPDPPRYVWAIAIGFGVYVMGITTLARDEAKGGIAINLRVGLAVMLIGAVMLALAPSMSAAADRAGWALQTGPPFFALIGMILVPVMVRAFRVQSDPKPAMIGATIKAAILTIIPLSAAFAMLGAGPYAGLCIFALMGPAILLAARLRVT